MALLHCLACRSSPPWRAMEEVHKGVCHIRRDEDPTADTLSDWSNVTPGLHASVISIDEKFPKSVAPQVTPVNNIELSAWKGEKVSAQLLLWTAEDVSQVECRFSNLVSEGNTLPATVAQARFVRYVMTDEFGPGCGRRKPGDFPASLAPDMLDNLECFNLEAKTARPVWLTISVPSDALAGNYRGKVTIYAKGRNRDFDISLKW